MASNVTAKDKKQIKILGIIVAVLLVVLWLLIRYHEKFSKNLKFLGWSYFTHCCQVTARMPSSR